MQVNLDGLTKFDILNHKRIIISLALGSRNMNLGSTHGYTNQPGLLLLLLFHHATQSSQAHLAIQVNSSVSL